VTDAEIYADLRLDMMRYATALVGVSDAADLVSAVVTRVLSRPGGLSGLQEAKPYLMKALLNEARMRHRAGLLHKEKLGALVSPPIQPERDDVLGLVMDLPPRQRAAVFLTYYEGYTGPEVAALMGCRPGTVRRYLHLARQALREVLDE
jgi:RNA polymerase sigma factor (sigma-70 family)